MPRAGVGGSVMTQFEAPDLGHGTRVAIACVLKRCASARCRPANEAENTVRGRVWDVGYLGGMSIYKVRLGDGTTMSATVANVCAGPKRRSRRTRKSSCHGRRAQPSF